MSEFSAVKEPKAAPVVSPPLIPYPSGSVRLSQGCHYPGLSGLLLYWD